MSKLTPIFYKFLHNDNTQDWIVIGIDAAIFVAKVVVFCVIFNSLCFYHKIGF